MYIIYCVLTIEQAREKNHKEEKTYLQYSTVPVRKKIHV